MCSVCPISSIQASGLHWFSLDSAEAHSGASVTVMSFFAIYVYICFFLYESVTYIYIYIYPHSQPLFIRIPPPPKIKKNGCQATGTLSLCSENSIPDTQRQFCPKASDVRIQCPRNSADCRARARGNGCM